MTQEHDKPIRELLQAKLATLLSEIEQTKAEAQNIANESFATLRARYATLADENVKRIKLMKQITKMLNSKKSDAQLLFEYMQIV